MCGIAGFIDFNKKSDFKILKEMTDILHHRGPDDSGYSFYENEYANIGLGHRRLSIIDLSSHGHQPMRFQNLEIVYNGEVYNFREIRKELEKYGYKFESNSDTEVILKAYYHLGIKAVDKFIGMFAIAIYDKKEQKLTLIRDRAGVKPFYYYFKNGLFMFVSELKSFHKHPDFQKEINIDALAIFFQFSYILQPYTIFQNTYKLPAGHYAEIDLKNQSFKVQKYWDIIDFYNRPKLNITFEEAKSETEKLLKSACEYRMIADVPVGIFLSGGYDSTAVTAMLQKDRSKKLKTFSIGFYEEKYNEAHHAKKVAEYLGTDHTEYYCTQKDAQELLPHLSEIWDEPFGDPSVIPTTLVSRIARQSVKVSLSADGGDEIFGGYDKYTSALKYKKLFHKLPLRRLIALLMDNVSPTYLLGLNKTYNFTNRYEKLKTLLKANNIIQVMNSLVYFFSYKDTVRLLGRNFELKTNFDDVNIIDSAYNDDIDRMMAIDYKTYLVDDILVKVDRATMSISLEGREPLLDHRIIEFTAQLPSSYKINGWNRKYILKSIVHDYVPKELMDRPKMGFGIPLHEWLMNNLREYVLKYLDSKKIAKTGLLNIKEVERLKYEWLKNGSGANKIWLILIFMMWHERWVDS
jgi:asparagine synthase (glutamine-hydrolysing)